MCKCIFPRSLLVQEGCRRCTQSKAKYSLHDRRRFERQPRRDTCMKKLHRHSTATQKFPDRLYFFAIHPLFANVTETDKKDCMKNKRMQALRRCIATSSPAAHSEETTKKNTEKTNRHSHGFVNSNKSRARRKNNATIQGQKTKRKGFRKKTKKKGGKKGGEEDRGPEPQKEGRGGYSNAFGA